MHVTCFLSQPKSSRRQWRHPKPERHTVDVLSPITLCVVVEKLQRPRARASTTKFRDLRLAGRALGHHTCHIYPTIELRKLVVAFLFQVRRCEQVQNSSPVRSS